MRSILRFEVASARYLEASTLMALASPGFSLHLSGERFAAPRAKS